MPEFITKRNDDRDPIIVQLKDGDDADVDLTGLTTVDITFHIKNTSTGVVNSPNATAIDDATAGIVRLATTGLVATAGQFEIEVEVTFADTTVKTYPLQDQFLWTILEDIA